MPVEGLPWIPREDLLSYEEIAAVVEQMAEMGLRRIRLTGGEPLVRRDLPDLVRLLRRVEAIDDISLSTNAVLMEGLAEELREAGVDRVNVSLDTLKKDRFAALARRPERFYDDTMAGIAAAERAGFSPIKINVVVMRGFNDDELADFAAITRLRPWHVRFIELMPTGDNLFLSDRFVSADELLDRLRRDDELSPVIGPVGNGPATYYRFAGAPGTVGVITPFSHNYCSKCNRMRLTADGQLRTCLFGEHAVDLKTPLRQSGSVVSAVEEALAGKPEKHFLRIGTASGSGGLSALSQVGG
jgi:cyclic pyranopterin phosphate synthase